MVFDLSVSIHFLLLKNTFIPLLPKYHTLLALLWIYCPDLSLFFSVLLFLSLIIGRPQGSLLRLFLLYYTQFPGNLILSHGFKFSFCVDDLYLQYRLSPLNFRLHPAAYLKVIPNRNSKGNMSMWSCLPKTTHLSIKAHSKSILPVGQVNNLGVIPDSFLTYPKCCEIILALPLKYIQHLTHSPAT